jgi:hypothetical protein
MAGEAADSEQVALLRFHHPPLAQLVGLVRGLLAEQITKARLRPAADRPGKNLVAPWSCHPLIDGSLARKPALQHAADQIGRHPALRFRCRFYAGAQRGLEPHAHLLGH